MFSSRQLHTYVLLLALLIAGCGRPADGTAPAPGQDDIGAARPTTVQPAPLQPGDFAAGALTLGMSQDAVRAALGEPDSTDVLRGPGTPWWRYQRAGVTVGLFPGAKPAGVVYIGVGPGFTGSTPRRIAIGSSASEVEKAYGSTQVQLGDDVLRFELKDGKVNRILLGRYFDPYGSGQRWNLALPENP